MLHLTVSLLRSQLCLWSQSAVTHQSTVKFTNVKLTLLLSCHLSNGIKNDYQNLAVVWELSKKMCYMQPQIL